MNEDAVSDPVIPLSVQICSTHPHAHTNTQHVCAVLHVKSGDEVVPCITDMMETIDSRQQLDKVMFVHVLEHCMCA